MLLTDEENRFQEGFIILSDGVKYPVLSNTDNSLFDDNVVVTGIPPTTVVGNSFQLFDDDYDFTSGDLIRPMPYELTGGGLLTNAFKYSYILPLAAPDSYQDNDAPFIRNLDGSNLTQWIAQVSIKRDLVDSTNFWAVYVLAAWQGKVLEDLDPDAPSTGHSSPYLNGQTSEDDNLSALYVETIQESEGLTLTPRIQEEHTLVHEIGHQGGGKHEDFWIMEEGAPHYEDSFAPITIYRFRSEVRF